ncbi:recombination protein RecR [Bermanella marisrubri]|uniref:Recombination protein RecR n=1 Tax=Bermanella marisrubri TaxID=207949 RepID=Q1N1A1_9GAMM|nr:recombination mediator RecR [Bermanella marisrubri]EAT11950.1 recombination protein RecR [Oceanobacter sp. RED65] [Bermanella marisrubri]QIZ84754.1 recombination protein RecR [Bermanella marisrubri]
MASLSPLINELVEALTILPGVGPKSAQRLALHLLEKDQSGAHRLVGMLSKALDEVGHCKKCRNLTEKEYCPICDDAKRTDEQLCVVETPAEVLAIEQTGFKGRYFVLFGRLSPIDGIGPEKLGLDQLKQQVVENGVKEVILATNPTVEGQATSQYIQQMLQGSNVLITRIAHGVPLGGELEYVDGGTLAHALAGRKAFD